MKLELGAIAKSIIEQLDEQDLAYDSVKATVFEEDRSALNRLRIRGILPPSTLDKGYTKLFRMIIKHIIEEENKQIIEDVDGQEGQYGAY